MTQKLIAEMNEAEIKSELASIGETHERYLKLRDEQRAREQAQEEERKRLLKEEVKRLSSADLQRQVEAERRLFDDWCDSTGEAREAHPYLTRPRWERERVEIARRELAQRKRDATIAARRRCTLSIDECLAFEWRGATKREVEAVAYKLKEHRIKVERKIKKLNDVCDNASDTPQLRVVVNKDAS